MTVASAAAFMLFVLFHGNTASLDHLPLDNISKMAALDSDDLPRSLLFPVTCAEFVGGSRARCQGSGVRGQSL